MSLERFRFGLCYAMAYELASSTDWTITALVAKRNGVGRDHVVHAFVESKGVSFDALGVTSKEELFDIFMPHHPEAIPTMKWVSFTSRDAFTEALKASYGDDEGFAVWERTLFAEDRAMARSAITEHRLVAQMAAAL